ncbi:hypothetical protein HPB50_028097 [Hyalomma asiaticum]|nr:hypothetical protein HPB50_028097 [Hyalomma asiaticum]
MPEDSVPRTDIVDEGLFTVVTFHKRREQRKAAKASATDKPTSAMTPLKTSRVSWRPAATPHFFGRNHDRAQASSHSGSES